MKIPKKARIGGINYEVRIVEDWPDSEGCHGEYFCDQKVGNVIFIRSTLSPEAQAATFIHEAMHAMNATMDHEFLDSFSEQIYAFLIDNNLCERSGGQ